MNVKNGINNEELACFWEQLHNIEEMVKDTPFSLDPSVMNQTRKHLQEADAKLGDDSAPVKIVVTGRMKSGKSMMADVLFFGGEGVLNSDATPATANITYIRCTDELHNKEGARVSFLKTADVKEMENYVAKQSEDGRSDNVNAFADNERYQASQERLAKINADPSKRDSLLGKEKWISLDEVKRYSDTGGEFSDFTDYIEVFINDSRLKGLEIVDTPGLGDPVVSRGQKARDESRTADIVFYLSRASLFMDMEDSDEFARLKKAGCKNMVLIMSQFDEVCEPEEEEIVDFMDTLDYDSIAEAGKERIRYALRQNGLDYEPVTIIPICALGAKLSLGTLEEDDTFYRNKMSDIFPDLSDKDEVCRLSGISRVQDEVEKAICEKERIREESNARMIGERRNEVLHICQSLKVQIKNDISMKDDILKHPERANKAVDALNNWEISVIHCIGNAAIGPIYDMIDAECANIIKELHKIARCTKDAMDSAQSPDSINGAYEYTFKNDVHEKFETGIQGRMRFDKGHSMYGRMFECFASGIRKTNIPEEVAEISSLSENLYHLLQDTFESLIHENYTPKLKSAMPIENTLDVLNRNYEKVRESSPDFKYKSNPTKRRAEKNNDAKMKCKKGVDCAEAEIIAILNQYSAHSIRDLFRGLKETLEAKLKAFMSMKKVELGKSNKDVIEKEICEYKQLLANLTGLEIAEQES